jgi:hypothetical protein
MASYVTPTYNKVSDMVNIEVPELMVTTAALSESVTTLSESVTTLGETTADLSETVDSLDLQNTYNLVVAPATGNVTIDLANGRFISLNAVASTGNFSVDFINFPINKRVDFFIRNGTTARTVTFPAGIGTRRGANNASNQYVFVNNGTTWVTIL